MAADREDVKYEHMYLTFRVSSCFPIMRERRNHFQNALERIDEDELLSMFQFPDALLLFMGNEREVKSIL